MSLQVWGSQLHYPSCCITERHILVVIHLISSGNTQQHDLQQATCRDLQVIQTLRCSCTNREPVPSSDQEQMFLHHFRSERSKPLDVPRKWLDLTKSSRLNSLILKQQTITSTRSGQQQLQCGSCRTKNEEKVAIFISYQRGVWHAVRGTTRPSADTR